ncbi:hypothetical protein HPB48_013439 [Haemaphysalis longicornis]|uniref:Uncharacterized protein n=1 Tax=Haemaphysalis longicornis TaxID=44386 RepID=A0A9J6GK66_HAELO|nr:hypothetical protein HPB48_013439 [Haemaphysalis longicornis]
MPGMTADAGDRPAVLPSTDASETEDNLMHQDPTEGECDETATDSRSNADWIEVVTRAQRRRERKPNPEVGLTAEPTTTTPSLTHKFAPRPAPLPRDDYKLVWRPQGGLRIAELDLAEVSLALLSAIQSTWRQTNLRVRYDMVQNTAIISTPSAEAAESLSQVPYYVTLFGSEYPSSLYKKTVPVCDACHELGHTATACPQPNTRVCNLCGVKDPKPGHDCKSLCSLCGGAHLTASKGCPKRFREPFRNRTKERASRVDQLALQVDQQASQQGHPASATRPAGTALVTDLEPHPREGEEIQAPGQNPGPAN